MSRHPVPRTRTLTLLASVLAMLACLGGQPAHADEREEPGVTHRAILPAPTTTAELWAAAMDINPGDIVAASYDGTDPVAVGISDSPNGLLFPRQGGSFAMISTGAISSATLAQGTLASTNIGGLANTGNWDLARVRLTLRAPAAAQCFAFDFAFYSEEYPSFVSGNFADVFTAEKGGTNITLTGTVVTAPLNFAFTTNNKLVSVTQDLGFNANTGNVYGGVTALLTAKTQVTGGQNVEIVFTIQDIGDSIYDSAVFLDRARWTADSNCAGGALTTGAVSGTVFNGQTLAPVNNAHVQLCPEPALIGPCPVMNTGADGKFLFAGQAPGHYRVSAYPPDDSLRTGSSMPFDLNTGQAMVEQNLHLQQPQGLPEGMSFEPLLTLLPGNVPAIAWDRPIRIRIPGCNPPVGSATIAAPSLGVPEQAMTYDPSDNTFFADVGPFYPHHGAHQFRIKRICPDPNQNLDDTIDVYIDPSGWVRTTLGVPIVGATVILYRGETPAGPFTQVPDGSTIMSPSNRTNPDLTDSEGHFGWDVLAGYYKVRASRAGCHAPGNPGVLFVDTHVMTIPPPVFDLDIRLQCGEFDPLDANCDFGFDGADVVYLLKLLAGLTQQVPNCPVDVNKDTLFNNADPLYLRKELAGLNP